MHLIGTAATKPVPRFFCTCRGCTVSRAEGGKSLRLALEDMRIQIAIDRPLPIDCEG